jgi:hypothetical protein
MKLFGKLIRNNTVLKTWRILFVVGLMLAVSLFAGCASTPEEGEPNATTPPEEGEMEAVTPAEEGEPTQLTGCEMIEQDKSTVVMTNNTNLRNVSFAEVILWCGDGGTFNTLSLNDPKDSAPEDLFNNINKTELAIQYQVPLVSTNPDTGRKFWTCDEFDILLSPTVRDFQGLKTRYAGDTSAGPNGEPQDLSAAGIPKIMYKETAFYRTSTLIFEKDKPVFLLEDTNGTIWVNKNYQTGVDPTLTIEGMATLDKRLKNLPEGWKFRTEILTEDLVIKADGKQRIMWDELGGAWDALEPGMANYIP